eukprot:GEMP01094152.1.p1 GENE.GEMP01094152.1~~GEMP01094152.1.p1  ORF type:complete len:204 (-),score=41.15 GEMP01094152.1:224-835(-)
MVKGNNVVPNVHFRNYWQKHVRTWFNQAGRKKTRRVTRQKKAAAIFPRPVAGLLRPLVHPPTQRYNMKLRIGRGFTLAELKEAGISAAKARTIGISVDGRRQNKCAESLKLNADRLKQYKAKLMVFPRGKRVKNGDTPREELKNVPQNTCKTILPVPKPNLRIKARAITAEEKGSSAYRILRTARAEKRNLGKKLKKEAAAQA